MKVQMYKVELPWLEGVTGMRVEVVRGLDLHFILALRGCHGTTVL